MVQRFWRVRLGEATGHKGNEKLYNLCKSENPPCIAVGWGKIDLSQNIAKIWRDFQIAYKTRPRGNEAVNLKRWVE